MAKSRLFSIYLLKTGYNPEKALDSEHQLGDSVPVANLPEKAVFYIKDAMPKEPWWKDYFKIDKNLKQVLKGAILFLPVEDRFVALTFGHTYTLLKKESYEYDFGLITTLNALDPNKIKSTDILMPETAKRARIQIPNESNLNFFDINNDESLIKKLTGKVKEEYQSILSNVSGANNIRISSKVEADQLINLCKKLLETYKKQDYKKSFPNINNVSPIKDPKLIKKLHKKLLKAFKDESIDLVLTIPEVIESFEYNYIKYKGEGASNNKFEDVYIDNYREYLKEKNISELSSEYLKKHKLCLVDENEDTKYIYSVYKCLLFDCELDSNTYHLCDGKWYYVEKNYIKKIENFLNQRFINHDVLISCNEHYEKDFSKNIVNQNKNYICLDFKNISPRGETQIEPSDLYTVEQNTAVLIHIKISTRSSYLSHLFNQGINSIQLIRSNEESKKKLKNLLKNNKNFTDPIDKNQFKVTYGIITKKNKEKKSKCLPLFSRISLKRAIENLLAMGIKSNVVLIEDKFNRNKKK